MISPVDASAAQQQLDASSNHGGIRVNAVAPAAIGMDANVCTLA